MKNQKTLAYHDQCIIPTEQENKELAALSNSKMSHLLKSCALKKNEISLENLHEHLRVAMTLELSTIPPYLCALYSIEVGDSTKADYQKSYGDNAEVATLIRSVMMEEMLHFTLVGNILNAVQGEIKINHKDFVPEYPTVLPDSAGQFVVHLSKFDQSSIKTFLQIEQPTPAGTEPKLDEYETIGQFYHAIQDLMQALEEEARDKGETIFKGAKTHQIDAKFYYGGGGEIIAVNNLKNAKAAIKIILEQGEGSEHSIYDTDKKDFKQINEISHYFKFNEIYEQQRYASCQIGPKVPPQGTRMDIKHDKVYNMGINPKTENFVSADLKNLSHQFNQLYRELLDGLQKAFTGHKDEFLSSVCQMYQLRYKAVELMRNPILGTRVNAGPTFEFLSDQEIKDME
ncbi:MAG: ferritin-like protein [Alcanivoracaceae bacterium]|nr:ferritin-like protein [Alcanivoracaceae bacterium]